MRCAFKCPACPEKTSIIWRSKILGLSVSVSKILHGTSASNSEQKWRYCASFSSSSGEAGAKSFSGSSMRLTPC